jgi:hypothetical protein
MDSRCPRQLKTTPNSPCTEGKRAVDAAKNGQDEGCAWFANDREANFCFFKFMELNGKAKDTAEIARVLLIDDSEVKKAVTKLRKHLAKKSTMETLD